MRCTASTRYDYLYAPSFGILSVVEHTLRSAVRRNDGNFIGYIQLFQYFSGFVHDPEIRTAAHNDAYYRVAHAITFKVSTTRFVLLCTLLQSVPVIVTCPIL